jgi:hypothetical protein
VLEVVRLLGVQFLGGVLAEGLVKLAEESVARYPREA